MNQDLARTVVNVEELPFLLFPGKSYQVTSPGTVPWSTGLYPEILK